MKALKLLTQVKTYVPSIYRALAKYACNLYRKCTSQVLKQNSLLSGNFILIKLTPTSKFLRLGFDLASGFHRAQSMKSRGQVDENLSGRRKWLEEKVKKGIPNTGIPLEIQTQDLKIGTKANQFDDVFNARYILSPNRVRTLFYLRPSLQRMCTVPLPSLHQEKDGAAALQVLCNYRETYYRGKRRLKESANKVRTDGFAFFMIFFNNVLAKIILKVRSVYRLFTNALLKWYRKGTGDVLESYQIDTNGSSLNAVLKATSGEAPYFNGRSVDQASVMRCICIDKAWIVRKTVSVYTLITHYQHFIPASSILDLYAKGASFQTSVFKHLKLLSWVKMCFCFNSPVNRLKLLLNNMLSSVHDTGSEWVVYEFRKLMGISFNALRNIRIYSLLVLMFFNLLDCFLMELKSIRTYSLLVLMVSMFSLSAQTPRKDSGADGLSHLMALKPGDKIPDAVWNQTLELNYFDGKKKTIKFSDLKGKLIILDFWSTGCAACIEGIPNMELIQDRFKGKVEIIMVNSKRNRDTPERIKNRFKKYREDFNYTPRLATLLDDTVFTRLFEHNTLPSQAILSGDGKFLATTGGALTDRNLNRVLYENSNPFEHIGSYVNLSRDYNDVITDTVGLSYSSSLSKKRPHYLPVGPGISHPNENSLMQMGNLSLQNFLSYLFMEELDGFSWNDYVFDPQLGQNFKQKLFTTSSENTYWYQLYKNAVISEDRAKKFARQDFMRYFEVGVQRKTDTAALYQISFNTAINKIQTKGKMRIIRIQELDEESVYQNVPIDFFLRNLFCYLDLPMYKFSKESFKIDITLPKGFINWTESQKVAFLKERGIVLTRVREKREFPYIYSLK
ncbi:TlpA family protein disulfide reductase [Sphingobacterium sp. UDSM-2020]|uniref:TlpA family protein disulfide reductase n=1 Tax=Sphingobacterium sp. UDSM-2020 TaxID=2795738 RepID=UPI00193606AD|nr:TlpA disulfide reductase family protein [Sphingobacterium sp. UDSM-2020]QQD15055.1 TlpA family protein disulfide reductase [Sphingobacterium sp. UDSM-2020]